MSIVPRPAKPSLQLRPSDMCITPYINIPTFWRSDFFLKSYQKRHTVTETAIILFRQSAKCVNTLVAFGTKIAPAEEKAARNKKSRVLRYTAFLFSLQQILTIYRPRRDRV